jgi:LytR cell envelope-related transcriptional attenuator
VADSPSGSRPLLRTGGIALLGVGVIAATIGLFTSATTGGGTGTAVPSASAQALPSAEPTVPVQAAPALPPTDAAVPADPGTPAATAPAVPDTPAPAAPPAPQPPVVAAPAPGAGGSASSDGANTDGQAVRAPLRVYNNSLIEGLAARAKSDFEAAGWTVTAISGFPGKIPQSTVYFRPGTSEEAAAQELGREFGLRVEPRFDGIDPAADGVIVIVTQDYKSGPKS